MLRNRIDPAGQFHAVPDRGTLMGNRGILHDEQNQIVRPWAHQHWVFCRLEFKVIKRPKPFSEGNYSELFFLDEATAFSAGHRPCNYCQRERTQEFKECWGKANLPVEQRSLQTLDALDKRLHKERAVRGGMKIVFSGNVDELPVGTMFSHAGAMFAVCEAGYRKWSFSGYGRTESIPTGTAVSILTPQSVVAAFRTGFVPQMHASASNNGV